MKSFEGQPQNSPELEGLQFTSRHTAEFEDRIYDVGKVIELAEQIPESEITPQSLEKLRDNNYWHDKEGNWLGPHSIIGLYEAANQDWDHMVAKQPGWEDHIQGVRRADYEKFPIIVVSKGDENHVIDGMHRLTKAWIDKADKIKAKRFEKLPDEAIVKSS